MFTSLSREGASQKCRNVFVKRREKRPNQQRNFFVSRRQAELSERFFCRTANVLELGAVTTDAFIKIVSKSGFC